MSIRGDMVETNWSRVIADDFFLGFPPPSIAIALLLSLLLRGKERRQEDGRVSYCTIWNVNVVKRKRLYLPEKRKQRERPCDAAFLFSISILIVLDKIVILILFPSLFFFKKKCKIFFFFSFSLFLSVWNIPHQ